nr:immunoglobulin heavy chain junction region [Macaca mulatta]
CATNGGSYYYGLDSW